LLARRNLIVVVAVVSLSAGVSAAWAASDELTREGEGSRLLDRPTKTLDRAIDKHRKRERQRDRRRGQRKPEWASASGSEIAGVPRSTLEAIAACESGGDPTAVSADGSYRGKYQFDTGTWAAIGGAGDPADAPEAEQDYRAALLYARSGSSPWPACG
jgi:soluble lytic murein transglycosylase-like protein